MCGLSCFHANYHCYSSRRCGFWPLGYVYVSPSMSHKPVGLKLWCTQRSYRLAVDKERALSLCHTTAVYIYIYICTATLYIYLLYIEARGAAMEISPRAVLRPIEYNGGAPRTGPAASRGRRDQRTEINLFTIAFGTEPRTRTARTRTNTAQQVN